MCIRDSYGSHTSQSRKPRSSILSAAPAAPAPCLELNQGDMVMHAAFGLSLIHIFFVSLYEKGLIYKGSRIINWCPHCVTALSDAAVEYVDKPGNLWHIRYPLSDGSGDIVVATTRPETMLGDTGVAVNPEDEKFKHLIGKTCVLPLVGREIPIVGDEYCEIGFGTGAVKMTPAHDPNDFEVGLRHNLEVIRVIADDGKINENGGKYEGMDRYECRKAIVKDLEEQGYLCLLYTSRCV